MKDFDLASPVDETLLPMGEQLRQVREQLQARRIDREGLKLQYQRALLAGDTARQTDLQEQAGRMTLEINAMDQLQNALGKSVEPKDQAPSTKDQ